MEHGKAKVWEENVVIPTYGIGEPNKNPMFLEKECIREARARYIPIPSSIKSMMKKGRNLPRRFPGNDYLKSWCFRSWEEESREPRIKPTIMISSIIIM